MHSLIRKSVLPVLFAGLAGCGGGTPPIAPPSVDIGDMTVTGRGTEGDPYVMPNTAPVAPGMGIETLHARGGYWRFPVAQITERHFARDQAALTAMTFNAGANEWILRYKEVGTGAAHSRALSFDAATGAYIGCQELTDCDHRLAIHDADPAAPQHGTFALISLRTQGPDRNYQSFDAIHGGMRTLPMTVPVLGSAVYEGTFEGRWSTTFTAGGSDVSLVIARAAGARIRIAADFTRGTFVLLTPAPGSISGAPFNVELTGEGRIAGNVFVGEVTVTLSEFPKPRVYTGSLAGAFYGAGALEVAATIRDSDTAGGHLQGGLWAGRAP